MSQNRRVIAIMEWPWQKDKKSPEKSPAKKSSISDSMKMKRQLNNVTKRLRPITSIVRKSNGQVDEKAVKTLIHSLEGMLKKE